MKKKRIGPKAWQIIDLTAENKRLQARIDTLTRSFEVRAKGQADRITQLRAADGWIENASKRYLDLLGDGTIHPYAGNARELLAEIFRSERDGNLR